MTQKRSFAPLLLCYKAHHLGVMPMNISKLMPGIGRDSTDRYSSLKRLLTVPLSERSAHLTESTFSSEMFDIKYGGSLPESDMSFDDMVYRSE